MSGPEDSAPTPPPGALGDSGSSGDDLYEIREEPKPQSTGTWYAGKASGERVGPFSLEELKRRMATGEVASTDLVWRDGMPDWIPANSVPELADQVSTAAGSPPPLTGRSPAGADSSEKQSRQPTATTALHEPMEKLDSLFSRPIFFRIIGRASAALGTLLLLVSLITVFFWRTFFAEAFLLLLVFMVGEAAGAILERLDRGTEEDS